VVLTHDPKQRLTPDMNDGIEFPLGGPLRGTLRKITERLAGELAHPSLMAPDWSPIEWRLAPAVAVIHCISPLLAGLLAWEGPAPWKDFLVNQKVHVAARHRRMQDLLDQIDACCREAGIAAIALKGAALHTMGLYSAGERPMADVDVLVQPCDSRRASQVLQSLGYNESFANWKHKVFVPKECSVHQELGEHTANYLKIELHTQIAELLPLRITDVTDAVYPRSPHPGLNAYPSKAALMIHLLIHAAGAMAYRALRIVHLHDIALVAAQMAGSDWDELADPGGKSHQRWWALPPLQLTARYYGKAIPAEVLAAFATRCPWTLRQLVRRYRVSDVSLSYPWIEAFPGIAWSQSLAETVQYMGGRIWPGKEMRRQRNVRLETDFVAGQTRWCGLSQRQRMLRWLTSKPLRVETMHAVRMALARDH
jgi:Uncharacterised nucleotidyltransferase